MLVVRIELHSAITGRVKQIGVMRISNVAAHDSTELGDYEVRVQSRAERNIPGARADFEGWRKAVTRTGEVKNYPRLSYNVWRLVLRALKSAFPEEK
jgi:hypothetical protein